MKHIIVLGFMVALAVAFPATAKKSGGSGSSRPSTHGPGTGSKGASTAVKAHVRRDGSLVQSHRRTTPDHNFNNNYSTRGNRNTYTGKDGSVVTPPKKP